MKEKKIAKQLKNSLENVKANRETLLSNKGEFKSYQLEDLRDFNEQILFLTQAHNYFTAPVDHI